MKDDRRLLTLLLPKKDTSEERELYYRERVGNVSLGDGELRLSAGAEVSFDCYFNVFDHKTYREHTAVDGVVYRLFLRGEATLRVYLCRTRGEKECEDLLLSEKTVSLPKGGEATLSLPLSDVSGDGFIYLTLTAREDTTFSGGSLDADTAPLSERVKIGVAITTFKRETFVMRNVARLLRDLPQEEFSVYVVDNGGTLSPSDVAGARLIPNKNLGGSGGFTRGILEILKGDEDCTHVLLTDDDISFESEIFRRTAAILRYAKDPDDLIVGGSMLFLDKPYYQHEFGAKWDGNVVISRNTKLDVRERSTLLANASIGSAEYTAWWFNCFPVTLPERMGLPFPFFIKIDDVEYCLRAHAKIFLTNGIGVWHECFENKYSATLEYYSKRNELILNALYGRKRSVFTEWKKLLRAFAKELIFQRYFALDLITKAYDDYLKGAEYFESIDGEKLHGELRAFAEKTRSREELAAMGYDPDRPYYEPKSFDSLPAEIRQVVTLNGYLLPARRDWRLVDMTHPRPKDFYRAKVVLQYNALTERGFVTRRSFGALLRTGFKAIGYFFKLFFSLRKANRSFRERFPEIISEIAWEKRLGLLL